MPTNDISSSSSLSLEQCDELLVQGIYNIRDAILGYTKHGLTQPKISARIKALGLKGSVATIKRHVAELRKEGLLEPVTQSQKPEAVRQRKHRASVTVAQNEPMSQPDQGAPVSIPSIDELEQQLKDKADAGDPYPKAMYLFNQLQDHLESIDNDNLLTDSQWLSLAGYTQGIISLVHARRDFIKRSQRDRAASIDVGYTEVVGALDSAS